MRWNFRIKRSGFRMMMKHGLRPEGYEEEL